MVNVPPLAVATSMLTANERPFRRRGAIGLHHDVANHDPAARHERLADLAEQLAVVLAGMLMHDRTDPGEIGPAGERIVIEIARHQMHAVAKTAGGNPFAGLLDGVGQIEDRGPRFRHGAEKGQRPSAGGPADIQQMPELGWGRTRVLGTPTGTPSRATSSSAIGPDMLCMAAMNAARSASAPRMLACRTAGSPLRTTHANCDHMRVKLIWCRTMGSTVPGAFSLSHGRNSAGTQ